MFVTHWCWLNTITSRTCPCDGTHDTTRETENRLICFVSHIAYCCPFRVVPLTSYVVTCLPFISASPPPNLFSLPSLTVSPAPLTCSPHLLPSPAPPLSPLSPPGAPGIISLCKSFEDMLQTAEPELFFHLTNIGAPPLRVAFSWIHLAFVGYLEADQILLLWDRVLGFGSNGLFLLPILANALFIFRSRALMKARNLEQVRVRHEGAGGGERRRAMLCCSDVGGGAVGAFRLWCRVHICWSFTVKGDSSVDEKTAS